MTPAPHPRGIGEILDVAAEVLLAHFLRLVGIAFVTLALVQGLFRALDLGGGMEDDSELALGMALLLVSLGAFLVSNAIINAVATRVTVRDLLGDVLPVGSLRQVLPSVIAVSLMATALMILLGVFTFGLGALIVWYKLLFAPNVVVAESTGPVQALRRSVALTRASFGRCVGVYLGALMLLLPLSLTAQELQNPESYQFVAESIPSLPPLGVEVLLLLLGALLQALPAAYSGAAFAALYADTLLRREGVDLTARLSIREERLPEAEGNAGAAVEELI